MTEIRNLLAFVGSKANGFLSFSASIRFGFVVAVAFLLFHGSHRMGRSGTDAIETFVSPH